MRIDRECRSNDISPRTVAPVVVNPLIDSNSAFAGFASVEEGDIGPAIPGTPCAAIRYGTAPTAATAAQVHRDDEEPLSHPDVGVGMEPPETAAESQTEGHRPEERDDGLPVQDCRHQGDHERNGERRDDRPDGAQARPPVDADRHGHTFRLPGFHRADR
jgi:hypothetical protein